LDQAQWSLLRQKPQNWKAFLRLEAGEIRNRMDPQLAAFAGEGHILPPSPTSFFGLNRLGVTETHIAGLTASGRHAKEIIGNVNGTSFRRISSDTFSDSWAILDNFEALFLEAVVVLQRLKR
jgi:hypothetical protein